MLIFKLHGRVNSFPSIFLWSNLSQLTHIKPKKHWNYKEKANVRVNNGDELTCKTHRTSGSSPTEGVIGPKRTKM